MEHAKSSHHSLAPSARGSRPRAMDGSRGCSRVRINGMDIAHSLTSCRRSPSTSRPPGPTCWPSPPSPRRSGGRSGAPTPPSGSTARSAAAPTGLHLPRPRRPGPAGRRRAGRAARRMDGRPPLPRPRRPRPLPHPTRHRAGDRDHRGGDHSGAQRLTDLGDHAVAVTHHATGLDQTACRAGQANGSRSRLRRVHGSAPAAARPTERLRASRCVNDLVHGRRDVLLVTDGAGP